MKVTINKYDRYEGRDVPVRYNLPNAAWTGDVEVGTGISLNGIYIGRERIIMEYYSIWDNGRGECVGSHYEIAAADDVKLLEGCLDADDFERACKILGVRTVDA